VSLCENCGKPTFFNHAVSSTRGDGWRHTHGYTAKDCERAAEVLEAMPVLYDMAIQSLVQTSDVLGRFLACSEDAEWEDPKALQRLLSIAGDLASEGVRTEKRWREAATVADEETR
jgi:hypothetical protein